MFSAALRRYVGDRTFDDLKQRLLYALARHVAGYGNIFALAGDFVYLIDINYAAFGFFNIEIGSLYQSEQDVFDILADIAGFGQRCGVGNGERYVDRLCKCARRVLPEPVGPRRRTFDLESSTSEYSFASPKNILFTRL